VEFSVERVLLLIKLVLDVRQKVRSKKEQVNGVVKYESAAIKKKKRIFVFIVIIFHAQ